ncbi:MAG: WYL domain-containing protein [Sphingobacteriales bacterium]|nr:MAG: WYL domain-containing protein [Sphingobacteriales bacterium]TAF82104.1 MAG: WYL domain-containing protein [Sphingobacteriales bacterium]
MCQSSKFLNFDKVYFTASTQNLNGILHAIQNRVFIKFDYQKYWIDEQTERTVAPYALKEFKNRWYVIAKDSKVKQIKSFGLDRLSNLDITKKGYPKQDSFDIDAHYKNSFGIISPNELLPEKVVLSFNAFQGKYVKSLPLHDSQVVILDIVNEVQIQLNLCITHDFAMELLSFGDNFKVIQPKTLLDKIKTAHYNAFKKY